MPKRELLEQNDLKLIERFQNNFDILELRIDSLPSHDIEVIKSVIQQIKQFLHKPLLLTYRTVKQGGSGTLNQTDYVTWMQEILQLDSFQMIDVEWEAYDESRETLVKEAKVHHKEVIVSYHNFDETPKIEVLKKIYFNMSKLGAEHLKIAVMPQSRRDVLTLLEAVIEASEALPQWVTGIAMGPLGIISRTAQESFGGALTYGALTEAVAPGQIHVQQLSEILPLYSLVENNTPLRYN
nr:type I 3-dehydroquinate dehydratase [Staphylococcus canis]